MKPTRVSTLVVVAVVCAAVTWLLLRSFYQNLPPLPWTGVPALLVAALVEAWTGRDPRARIAGRRPEARRAAVRVADGGPGQGQFAGRGDHRRYHGRVRLYLSGSLSAAVPRQDALTAVLTFVAAVLLGCAALFLEYCCRVPEGPDRDQRDGAAS